MGSRGRPELIAQIKNIMEPINRMEGDSLPVSAFMDHADGQFEQGASAYEKRGVAVMVPHWDADKCIQCNQCSFVCPHATIRPFGLTEDEIANAPEGMRTLDIKMPKDTGLKFHHGHQPARLHGLTPTARRSARRAPSPWCRRSRRLEEQKTFDYCVENVSPKPVLEAANVKGSQFKQPLLEFSGSCAGCAETAYARLVTQVCGDRMFISNATGCSSIWGNPAARSPYTVNAEGHGPAWNNSLFEDNAEHGLGMFLGYEARPEQARRGRQGSVRERRGERRVQGRCPGVGREPQRHREVQGDRCGARGRAREG